MKSLNIKSANAKTHIFIDGKRLEKVTRFCLEQNGNNPMRLMVWQIPGAIRDGVQISEYILDGDADIICKRKKAQPSPSQG